MAFQVSDREKLDKAKISVEMNYLDVEMQKIGRALVLFDECYLDNVAPPVISTVIGGGASSGSSNNSTLGSTSKNTSSPPSMQTLSINYNDIDKNDEELDEEDDDNDKDDDINLDDIDIPLGTVIITIISYHHYYLILSL